MSEYIEREAVMDALLHEQYGYLCEDAIKAIPAADVCPYYVGNKHDRGDDSLCRKAECEVKDVRPVVRGKWESVDDVLWLCSKCHYAHGRSNYCPNCGAWMEER